MDIGDPFFCQHRRFGADRLLPARIEIVEIALRVSRPGDGGHAVNHAPQPLFAFLDFAGGTDIGALGIEPPHDRLSQHSHALALEITQALGMALCVDHA